MKLKSKDKKLFGKSIFYTILFNEKIVFTRVFLWKIPDQDPVFSWIQMTQKDCIRIRIRNTGKNARYNTTHMSQECNFLVILMQCCADCMLALTYFATSVTQSVTPKMNLVLFPKRFPFIVLWVECEVPQVKFLELYWG